MNDPRRLLDANLNRAREAARVLEDAARFLLDDGELAGRLKALRHELTAAAGALPGIQAHRDTPGDVGTALTADQERSRRSAREVVLASGKRLGEALRCLEEYGKLVDARFAESMKALRYRAYALEAALLARLPARTRPQWRVCVLLTESLCGARAWEEVAERAVDAGAEAVQLREKALSDRELLRRARRLVDLMAGRAAVVVNDRPDIALLAGAQGVHLGQTDLAVEEARRLVGEGLLLGVSTHDLKEAEQAVRAGADCCGVGCMFPTAVKPELRPSGLGFLQEFLARFPEQPHLAIGGVTPENVAQLAAVGCRGVAVGSAVCRADDPGAVVAALRAALERG